MLTTTDVDTLSINTIRTLAMDAVQQANSGHPGTPMAMAPVAYALCSAISGSIRSIPSGRTAIASCSRWGTPRCCCTRCCTSRA